MEEPQLGQHTEEPETERHSAATIEAEIQRNDRLWSKATCAWKVLCPAAALSVLVVLFVYNTAGCGACPRLPEGASSRAPRRF